MISVIFFVKFETHQNDASRKSNIKCLKYLKYFNNNKISFLIGYF